MSNATPVVVVGAQLVELGMDIAAGRYSDALTVARRLEAILVAMLPVDELKNFLRPEDRAFADMSADIAEDMKVNAEADAAEADKVKP